MLTLVAVTMGIIHLLPKLTSPVPASLVAIGGVTLTVMLFDIDTRLVQDVLRDLTGDPTATIAGGLPCFHLPVVPFTLESLQIILPYSFILAGIGLIESLLTMSLIDELTETRFLWALAGSILPPAEVERALKACLNLMVELSPRDPWRHLARRIDEDGQLKPEWRALVIAYADRFMVGSDPIRSGRSSSSIPGTSRIPGGRNCPGFCGSIVTGWITCRLRWRARCVC